MRSINCKMCSSSFKYLYKFSSPEEITCISCWRESSRKSIFVAKSNTSSTTVTTPKVNSSELVKTSSDSKFGVGDIVWVNSHNEGPIKCVVSDVDSYSESADYDMYTLQTELPHNYQEFNYVSSEELFETKSAAQKAPSYKYI